MFENKKILNSMRWMTFLSIASLVFFVFVSVSVTALSHIFIVLPGIYFLVKAIKERTLKLSPSAWALLALTVIGIISILINPVPLKKISSLKYFLLGGIFSIFAYKDNFENFFTSKRTRVLLHAFFLAAAFASLVGIYAYFTGYNPIKMKPAHPTRAGGLYGMVMTYGYGIGFLLVISAGGLLYWEKLKEYLSPKWHLFAFISNLIGFVLSQTRGGIIGLVVSLPLLFWNKGKKWVAGIYILMILATVIGVWGTQFGDKAFLHRQSGDQKRWSQFVAAVYAAKENPFFGVGYKCFEGLSTDIKKRNNIIEPDFGGHAHNNFLEHLASTGILGFIAFMLFHVFWAREMFRRKDLVGHISLAFILYLASSGMFQYTFGDGENTFLIMFIYALGQTLPKYGEDCFKNKHHIKV